MKKNKIVLLLLMILGISLVYSIYVYKIANIDNITTDKSLISLYSQNKGNIYYEILCKGNEENTKEIYVCILRSLADSDAFQSGRCAAHNGRPETLAIIN